jgi:hypothetical protein
MGKPALPKFEQLKHYSSTTQKVSKAVNDWILTGIWIDPRSDNNDSTLAGLYQVRKAVQEAAAKRNMPFIVGTRRISFQIDMVVLQIPRQKRTEKVVAHFILLCEDIEREPSAHQVAQKPYLRMSAATAHIYVSEKSWKEIVEPCVQGAHWKQLMRLT